MANSKLQFIMASWIRITYAVALWCLLLLKVFDYQTTLIKDKVQRSLSIQMRDETLEVVLQERFWELWLANASSLPWLSARGLATWGMQLE